MTNVIIGDNDYWNHEKWTRRLNQDFYGPCNSYWTNTIIYNKPVPYTYSFAQDGTLTIKANLAGIDPKDIKVTVCQNTLKVSTSDETKSFEYALLGALDPETVQAESVHGMLIITVSPKQHKDITVTIKT